MQKQTQNLKYTVFLKKLFGYFGLCSRSEWSEVAGEKRQYGFTLVETLIYVSIVGTIITSFVLFSVTILNVRNKNYVVQEVQANARVALGLIGQKIRMANGINTVSSTFTNDPGYLSLSMASTTLNPTIISLDQDDGILSIKEGASATTSVTSDEVKITNLVFTNLSSARAKSNIRVEFTVEFDNPSGDVEFNYSQSLQTSVGVRE